MAIWLWIDRDDGLESRAPPSAGGVGREEPDGDAGASVEGDDEEIEGEAAVDESAEAAGAVGLGKESDAVLTLLAAEVPAGAADDESLVPNAQEELVP